MADSELLNVEVLTWANQLIHGQNVVPPNSSLTAPDFTKLLNSKTLKPILRYLVHHVKPNADARHIRLNLKHARIKSHLIEDEKGLPEFDKRLNLEASILDVQSSINNEVQELQALNHQKENLLRKEKELCRRTSLIRLGSDSNKKETEKCRSCTSQLQSLLPQRQQDQMSSNLHKKGKEDLQDSFRQIENLRTSFMNSNLESDKVHQIKINLWNLINDHLEVYSPSLILSSLTKSTRDAINTVVDTTNQVDLIKDARQLRLKCEADGTFIDEANEGGVIESVRGMLIEMSGSHVKYFLEANKTTESASSLSRALESLHSNIHTAAKRQYKDPVLCEMITNFASETIHLTGDRAAVTKCQEMTNVFQKRVYTANRAKEQLLRQQERIFQFNNQVQNGMKQIRSLVQSVEKSWDVLHGKLTQVNDRIDAEINNLILPTNVSEKMLAQEILEIQKFPLDLICTMDISEKKVSRYYLSTEMTAVPDDLSSSISSLNQAAVKSEHIAQTLANKKQTLNNLKSDLNRASQLQHQIINSSSSVPNLSSYKIKELCNKVDKCDEKLEENVEPLLKKCENLLSSSLKTASHMDVLLKNWWDQPAQHIKMN